ncbi:hypothetical protein CGC48_11495 [Capnocytophaga cynodegmi]|uniref:Uncharacterized protein n=1 Tax=Capnocytophaga cynodegmi TaxID=28189 RepID=A0A250EBS0_9FLAO|nr:hypothetical protein [Capnocytophaga cynodegmi]ATA69187.1 hypothetical protein CGC48_11495 [Capnocytophaga cynodegmi]
MENQEIDNGLELLKKVIKSNEENIEKNSGILMVFEDLLNLLGETESTLRGASYTLENSQKVLGRTSHILESTPKTFEIKASKEELKAQEQFINSIPKCIEAHIPEKLEKDLILLNRNLSKVNMKSGIFKYSILGGIGSLILSIILLWVSGYFAQKWYAEIVKTKEEIRKELLIEFENKGKGIYDVESYEKLQYNTDLMDAYPKEGKEFMKFKKGFESR